MPCYYLSRAVLAHELRTQLERAAQPVVLNLRAVTAIGALLDAPPEPGFSAWRRRGHDNRRIDPALPTFDAADADRLERLTVDLLAAVA